MAYTYNDSFPTDKDKLRALIRDTDENDWILSDEEIALYASLAGGNIFNQAAACADAAANELGRQLSVKDTIDSHEQWEMMKGRAESLRSRAVAGAVPYAGGISVTDKDSVVSDTDRPSPAFTTKLFEYG